MGFALGKAYGSDCAAMLPSQLFGLCRARFARRGMLAAQRGDEFLQVGVQRIVLRSRLRRAPLREDRLDRPVHGEVPPKGDGIPDRESYTSCRATAEDGLSGITCREGP